MKHGLIWLLIPLVAATGALAIAVWPTGESDQDGATEMVVYKTPTCGCCDYWVDHVRDAGFTVTAHDISHAELNQKKREGGLGYGMASCHTAFIEGYTIEGHVPAAEIRRLLEQQPDVAGLTVPGMPIGSPGMEQGDRQDAYEVLSFQRDGRTEIFAEYPQ